MAEIGYFSRNIVSNFKVSRWEIPLIIFCSFSASTQELVSMCLFEIQVFDDKKPNDASTKKHLKKSRQADDENSDSDESSDSDEE